jgi:uncharacterized NAD(P)/FAD-binding protein YdhS
MHSIVIIGGGFSGSLAAVNLARFGEMPLRVALVNQGFPMGRGVAYSTKRAEHLLNVASRNMSALADQPNHFVEWLLTRSEYTDMPESLIRETFVPRRIYGDYVQNLLQWYASSAQGRSVIQVDFFHDEAIDISVQDSKAVVQLASGETIEANKVLLATGHQPPADVNSMQRPFQHPRYCDNPWRDWENNLPQSHENVVILGTGLTMVDAFLTLTALDWRGTIFAVSRNGLLPQSHFRGIEYPDFPPDDPSTLGLAELVAMMESHCARLKILGANPAIVVDKLRPHTQRIWQAFSTEEKREFVQSYAPRWNVTRHRIAAEIYQKLMIAQADGRLRVVTGRVDELREVGSRIGVSVEGASGTKIVLEAGFVINGTGPKSSFTGSCSKLFQNLLHRGMLEVDDLDMGIRVDSDFTVFERDGRRSDYLFAVGPLLKGTLWETIAVPELRGQTLRVSQTILDQLAVDQPLRSRWTVPDDSELLEYCI